MDHRIKKKDRGLGSLTARRCLGNVASLASSDLILLRDVSIWVFLLVVLWLSFFPLRSLFVFVPSGNTRNRCSPWLILRFLFLQPCVLAALTGSLEEPLGENKGGLLYRCSVARILLLGSGALCKYGHGIRLTTFSRRRAICEEVQCGRKEEEREGKRKRRRLG
jgi:hypothetical protein